MKTEILEKLQKQYPEARCELDFDSHYELLVAVILSAQCTDKRVNLVTKELFALASTPEKMLLLGQADIEKLIYSCGFYRQKSKSIIAASRDIIEKHGGQVPNKFEDLVALRGVGRKTANVVLSVAYNQSTIAVDTHVFRVSKRLGFSTGKTPFEVEKDLIALFDETERGMAHNLLIFHGRYCCRSQTPNCRECAVKEFCVFYKNRKEA